MTTNNLSIPVSIVIAGALIAFAVYFSIGRYSGASNTGAGTQPQPQAQQPQPAQAIDIAKVKIAGEPFIGNPNASVTIAYWYDYQCPFCKRSEEDALPQLISDYIKTGKAKLVYKDFQFLGPDSQTAGLISRAVWDTAPAKFYQWHKVVYDKQDGENYRRYRYRQSRTACCDQVS